MHDRDLRHEMLKLSLQRAERFNFAANLNFVAN